MSRNVFGYKCDDSVQFISDQEQLKMCCGNGS